MSDIIGYAQDQIEGRIGVENVERAGDSLLVEVATITADQRVALNRIEKAGCEVEYDDDISLFMGGKYQITLDGGA